MEHEFIAIIAGKRRIAAESQPRLDQRVVFVQVEIQLCRFNQESWRLVVVQISRSRACVFHSLRCP